MSLCEPENVAVEFYPVVHLSLFDVSDDMVLRVQSDRLRFPLERYVSWREYSVIVVTLYERVNRVTVGCDGCASDRSMVVFEYLGCLYSLSSASNCLLVRPVNIVDSHGNIGYAVSMCDYVPGDWDGRG